MNFKIIQNPILSNAIHSHYLYFLVFFCFWFQILKSKKMHGSLVPMHFIKSVFTVKCKDCQKIRQTAIALL